VFPFRDFTLKVYSPASKKEAPIVLLRDSENKIKWAVYAVGQGKTQVASLKFSDYRTVFDTTVRGSVDWTYGHEATW